MVFVRDFKKEFYDIVQQQVCSLDFVREVLFRLQFKCEISIF